MILNVLIVDDSATIRSMINKALSLCVPQLGQVHEAADGIAALAVLADNKVDVVLMDVNMPRMNGLQLAKKLKEDPSTADLPVIVISTEGSDERLDELKEYDVAGYIRKPFRPEQLRKALHEALEFGDPRSAMRAEGPDRGVDRLHRVAARAPDRKMWSWPGDPAHFEPAWNRAGRSGSRRKSRRCIRRNVEYRHWERGDKGLRFGSCLCAFHSDLYRTRRRRGAGSSPTKRPNMGPARNLHPAA